jgi:hypothetical protein
LAFVQLVEAPLHGAAVKEPLLTAVVSNEAETPVPNDSLDRAAWHSSLLGRACPDTENQYSFRRAFLEIGL